MITRRIPSTGGVGLAVDTWPGDDVGLLLVHGLASNARLWDGVAERLAGYGHAVTAVDQRGHGRSDKPDGGYDFPTVCSDLTAVLAALRVGTGGGDGPWAHPVVVGQSWGANVVLELAWRDPGQLGGVACVDGGVGDLTARFPTWEECAAALAPPRFTGTPVAAFETAIRLSHPSWPESGILGTLANVEVRADGTVAPWLTFERHMQILRSLYDEDLGSHLAEIPVPVLLVPADTGDGAWTAGKQAGVEAALASIPVARARWFAPADHDIHAQFPDELAHVLHDAVAGGFFG
ncbi:MAG: alpha/beta fold hydrolase [Acidimicrobiales bacterium]